MSDSTAKIMFSILIGGIGFLVLLVPALVLQYRRFGRPSVRRLLGTAAACVYAIGLVAFTLFPLPSVADACGGRTGAIVQAIPLRFVADIAEEARATSWPAAMASFAVFQVVLNVVLFVPLGALLRSLGGRGLRTTVLLGLAVSLAVEATQYTGIWGLYPCGFRVADVDDLLANTSGAWIGAAMAPRLLGWMPRASELAASRPATVTGPRRVLGMFLDAAAFAGVELTAAMSILAVQVLRDPDGSTAMRPAGALEVALTALVAGAVVFGLPALVGTGASLGQRLVGVAPVWDDPRGATLGRRLLRTLPVGGVYTVNAALPPLLTAAGVPLLPTLIGLASFLGLVVALVWATRGDHRGMSGAVSGARMADVRSLAPRR